MTRRLPASESDLRGLSAARWIRESTPGQLDLNGPKEQRDEQDDTIDRLGLKDTGLEWQAGHSGWRETAIASSAEWADMLARAGVDYRILVVAYVSRFCRNVKLGTAIREQIHGAGATIYFCDERILLSNEDDWKRWIDLLVTAEHYSRDLSKRVSRAYRSKWRHHNDPGGRPALGFTREPQPPRRLMVDPATIGTAIRIFQRYATGAVSMFDLACETGIHEDAVREMLRNPIYNGWVRRKGEAAKAAPWRDNPPVSDELWERAMQVREAKVRGGGPKQSGQPDPLRGLLHCRCGRYIRADGTSSGRRQRLHPDPCHHWTGPPRHMASLWEEPIKAQVRGIDVSDVTIARVVAGLQAPEPSGPSELATLRRERQRKELALDYAAGRIDEATFLSAVSAMRAEPVALPREHRPVTPAAATAYLRDLASSLQRFDELVASGDVEPREQAEWWTKMIRAVYARITVVGATFVEAQLTPAAYRHGLAVALPEAVQAEWRARPDSNRRSPA